MLIQKKQLTIERSCHLLQQSPVILLGSLFKVDLLQQSPIILLGSLFKVVRKSSFALKI